MGERNRDMSRRELLARGAAVGGLALTGSLGTAFAQESAADMFGSINTDPHITRAAFCRWDSAHPSASGTSNLRGK